MSDTKWESMAVTPQRVFEHIEPGMNIFIGTGAAEPRLLVRELLASDDSNLRDLSLLQVVSLGDALSPRQLHTQKFRLKTFYSGWVSSEAITEGRVDLIPCRFAGVPRLIASGRIPVDAAFVQVTPPNEAGFCSLGVAVDAARQAMDRARLTVAEINPRVPCTFGDTFIPIDDFDLLVRADEEPLRFPRFEPAPVFDEVAANVAAVIEDGSCLAFSIGPLFEALAPHLKGCRNLGLHTPLFTDACMDLVQSGAVTNRYKEVSRGKTLTSYAFGTERLLAWLGRNPLVEFQGIDLVFDPCTIGRNPRFVALLPARRVDISGRIALPPGKGNVVTAPAEVMDFIMGAELSRDGRTIFALPSRNREGTSNFCLSLEGFPNLLPLREAVDMVVTEYGVASLKGRTVRERAQALIDIAHPDDRADLVEQARAARILFADQMFLAECTRFDPAGATARQTFKGDVEVCFRPIRPSDEEEMRRLFYRFSDQTVYYRYFTGIKIMPHTKMQAYVNVDCNHTLSIVGLNGTPGEERIIAEARYVRDHRRPYADIAFVVDEDYQGRGIASFLYGMLIRLAREAGLAGFTADVLATNKTMMQVFEKGELPVKARLASGIYELVIPFESP